MKTKEEILALREVTKDELETRMFQDLKMVNSYLKKFIEDWECKRGEHEWDEWSARLCENVKENELMSEDFFRYRACCKCGQEMPKSRIYKNGIRELNALDFKHLK